MSNNDSKDGAQQGKKVISIQGNSIPKNTVVNTETGGRSPDQLVTEKQTNQTQPLKQSGGGPEGPAVVDKAGLQASVRPNTVSGSPDNVTDPDNLDIDKFIADSTGEVKQFDEKEAAKKEKMAYLTKAIESTNKFRKIVFNNAETGEFVGTKIQYEPNEDGKSVYEYMNDPKVTEHIEFVVAEDDPVDGQPVDKQITFFWIKPTF